MRENPIVPRGAEPRIVCIGKAAVDVYVPCEPEFVVRFGIEPGSVSHRPRDAMEPLLALLDSPRPGQCMSAGGCAANTCRVLAMLGAHTVLVSSVADDPLGAWYRDALRAQGLTARFEPSRLPSTGLFFSFLHPGGGRTIVASPAGTQGVGRWLSPESDFGTYDLVYLDGYLAGEEDGFFQLLERLEDAGERYASPTRAGLLLAMDLGAAGIIQHIRNRLLPHLFSRFDFVFANEAEHAALSGDPEHARDSIHQDTKTSGKTGAFLSALPLSSSEYILKRGSRGASWFRGQEHLTLPACAAEVVDETGAGDVLAAAFLVSRLSGEAPLDALMKAQRVAAKSLEFPGVSAPPEILREAYRGPYAAPAMPPVGSYHASSEDSAAFSSAETF